MITMISTDRILKSQFCLKWYSCVVCVRILVTISEAWSCFIWRICIEKLWMLLWWTETDPSFFRTSLSDGTLSLWTSCRYFLCKCLVYCYSCSCEASKLMGSNYPHLVGNITNLPSNNSISKTIKLNIAFVIKIIW